MKRWMTAIVATDLTLLIWMVNVRVFCVEWLSCSAQRFERSTIVAYFACSAFPLGHLHHAGLRWEVVLCDGFVCGGMWLEHCRSSRQRMYKCCDFTWIMMRVSLVVLAIILGVTLLLSPPHHWTDIALALQLVFYTALHYSTSLPEHSGRRGRKRKRVWSKLKEWGRGRMPVPDPTPA